MPRLAAHAPSIDRTTLRRLAIALLVAGMVATAGCTDGLSDGDDGGPATEIDGPDPIEYVPQGQDLVVHVDVAVVADQTTLDLAAALENGELEEDPQDSLEEFEAQSGLDATALQEVLVYGESSEYSLEADASTSESYGVVFRSGWTEDELVTAIERNQSTALEVQSHQGRDVLYGPIESDDSEEPSYLGVLGNGTFVLGNEAAVTDSLDVTYGDASAVSGQLRDAYESAPDGLVTFAMVVPQDALDEQAGAGMGATPTQDVEAFNGVYTTDGGNVVLETQLLITSEESASQLHGVLDQLLSAYADDPQFGELVGGMSAEQDGTTVRITFEASPDEIESLLNSA